MRVYRVSVLSGVGRFKDIPCTEEDFDKWEQGACIQNVLHYLNEDDREFLISGITPEEWFEFAPQD